MSTIPLQLNLLQEGVSRSRRAPAFPTADEPNPWVSKYSRWMDATWRFEVVTEGSTAAAVACWDAPLPGSGNLLDEEHSRLLHELRCLALSCFIDRRGRTAYKTTMASALSVGFRMLARWMISNHYDSLSQLDAAAFTEYREDILSHFHGIEDEEDKELEAEAEALKGEADNNAQNAEKVEVEEEVRLTYSVLWLRFQPWMLLWGQRIALEDLGIPISQEPFHPKPIGRLCAEMATVVWRRIPPVPDAVAVEVLNAAHLFIDRVADDLIKFSRIAAPIYAVGTDEARPHQKILHALRNWGGLKSFPGLDIDEEVPLKSLQRAGAVAQLSEAFAQFTGASATIIQAETGMRINEVVAVPSGWNAETDLPSCIDVKTSASGAMDLYYLKATLSKTLKSPVEARWLLGARLKEGSQDLPAAVRAVVLLHQVFDPWRSAQDDERDQRLMVMFGVSGIGFPWGGGAVLRRFAHSTALRKKCRAFIERNVDLSHLPDLPELREYKETRGACIKNHQWRKSYARFVYHVDGRLLPAIARQYKHVSLAMTEGAYVGAVTDALAEHNQSKAVDLLLDFGRGKPVAYEGRLAKTLERFKAEITELIAGESEHEAYATLHQWACDRNLRMFFHGYGECIPGLVPTEAECHKKAGTTHWANREPNYRYRQASVCTGCFLFIASPETVDYWTQRFVENMTAWIEAKRIGRESEFRVQLERAQQSEKYLRTLGAPIPITPITPVEAFDGR